MVKHKVGDLVYYKSNKRSFSNENQASIGIITKCYRKKDAYLIKWSNEEDDLFRNAHMVEFSSVIVSWFKRDLEEAIENGEVSP